MNMIDQKKRPNVQPEDSQSPRPLPASPHPLDGSQFHNVVEEQAYAELPPTREEQAPRRARHRPEPETVQPHPDDPSISVGPS